MNIVFLDIDGVLVNRKSLMAASGYCSEADPQCVRLLNRITKATNACIVVSSAWRIGRRADEIRKILKKWGVRADVIGLTPEPQYKSGSHMTERGEEIALWLEANPGRCDNFVILDDDADMHPHMTKLVRTNFNFGLRESHVKMAIELLRGE